MKRSSDGPEGPQEEPIQKLREENHASGGRFSANAEQGSPRGSGISPRKRGKGQTSRNSGNGNGSERAARTKFRGRPNNSGVANNTGDVEKSGPDGRRPNRHGENNSGLNGRPGGKNSRSRNNRNRPNDQGQLRNVRAPARRTPDVTYDPNVRPDDKSANAHQNSARRGNSHGNKRSARNTANDTRPKYLYAALDLGTNNCRLLIAAPQEVGRFRVVDAFSRIVRLGEGLAHTGSLSQEAMQRSIEALKVCASKLEKYGIRRARLIATEACRQATNGEEFLQRVKNETGLVLEIVNRETEARLAAEGCGTLMDRKADAAVLFDIGGGSSELILIDRNRAMGKGARSHKKPISEKITAWTSLPLGVVTLAERHGGREVSKTIFNEMVAEVIGHLDAFEGRDKLAHIWKKGRVHLLGTSGTVTTIAGVHLNLPRYDRRKVDGIWLGDDEIDTVIAKLLKMDFDQRARNPCIGQERADLVLAGCAILQAIRITWPCRRLRVADRGLREGLLNEMISGDGAWITPKKDRWRKKRRRKPSGNSKFGPSGDRKGDT